MKATIIGGGISGLTMALALEKVGIDYVLYEKAATLNEVGAGIWVSTNAMLVFDWLGIANKIKQKGLSLQKIAITDQYLNVLQETHQQIFKEKLGFSGVAIHRAVLQKTLFDEIPARKIKLGAECNHIETSNTGCTTFFKNGEKSESDIVIAADGIHSNIRKQLFPESTLRDSGQICWRGISNMVLPNEFKELSAECWGNEVRFGFSSIAPNQIYWFAVAKSKHISKNLSKKELKDLFSSFHPLVDQIISNTQENEIIFKPLADLKPIHKWHSSKIMLIGDAAHATTPNLGQGAAQGIEDTFYLSQMLKRDIQTDEAFRLFEETRRSKVDSIVNTSWLMGKLAHIKRGQQLRNLILKSSPKSVMTKRMLKIYSLKPIYL